MSLPRTVQYPRQSPLAARTRPAPEVNTSRVAVPALPMMAPSAKTSAPAPTGPPLPTRAGARPQAHASTNTMAQVRIGDPPRQSDTAAAGRQASAAPASLQRLAGGLVSLPSLKRHGV